MIARSLFTLSLAALLGSAAAAQTPPPASGKPASIPFVRFGQIDDFEPDSDRGVYLRTIGRKWYYASMFGPCTELPFATRIAVKTWGSDSLDQYGSLLVDGRECRIDRLTASGPPPKKVKHKR